MDIGAVPYVLAAGQERSHPGTRPTIKAGAADTGGAMTVVEDTLAPWASGPPLHAHDSTDECLYVAAGKLLVQIGEERHHLEAGSFAGYPGAPRTPSPMPGRSRRGIFGVTVPVASRSSSRPRAPTWPPCKDTPTGPSWPGWPRAGEAPSDRRSRPRRRRPSPPHLHPDPPNPAHPPRATRACQPRKSNQNAQPTLVRAVAPVAAPAKALVGVAGDPARVRPRRRTGRGAHRPPWRGDPRPDPANSDPRLGSSPSLRQG